MQNKPNFRKVQMDTSSLAVKDYENETAFGLQKYKPNQSQFQTGHLLVNRMKTKFLNFSPQKKFDSTSEFAKIMNF